MTLSDAANIATIVGSLAVIGIFIQVLLAFRQLKADHERSRREKSVEMLLEWSKHLKEDSSSARKIAESLSEEQSRKLYNQESVKVDATKFKSSLKKILELSDDNNLEEHNDEITLNEGHVSKLRWYIVSYLNMLESILVAWQYSIIDRDIIERQFSYLISPEQGHYALKHFRSAAGGEKVFPAIEMFSKHLDEKRRKNLKGKPNVA